MSLHPRRIVRGSEQGRRLECRHVECGQSQLLFSLSGVERWGFTLKVLHLCVIWYLWNNPKFLFPATFLSASVSVEEGLLQGPLHWHMILVVHREDWGNQRWEMGLGWGVCWCWAHQVNGRTYSFPGKSEGGGFHSVKTQKHVTQRQCAGKVFGKSRFGVKAKTAVYFLWLSVSDSKVASAAYMSQIFPALV